MKNFGRTVFPAVGVSGALVLLAAAPQAVSAQTVIYQRSGASAPAPSQSPQAVLPMRSGAILARPGGTFGPSSVYTQPGYNPPNFNRPVFNSPIYNNGAGYNNAPVYNNGSVYGNGQVFRNEQSSGPVVVVPDPYEGASGLPDRRLRPGRFGAAGGASGLEGYPFGSRSGDSNARNFRLIRPVGPAYGNPSPGRHGETDFRPTAPPRGSTVYRNVYIYNNSNPNAYNPAPAVNVPLLGGYYYGNYCDAYASALTYPSVYSVYAGFPQYIFNATPNVIIVGQPMAVPYVTPYLPFDTPAYSVTYNQNNYYVASESRAREIEGGGAPARAALKNAYPADSYQAAFADIARAWTDGDIAPFRKHIRDTDTRVSVFLNKKYSYSIASGDFVQITRDALDRLHTISFDFTRLRKAKTGDVTAYGTHVYRTGDAQTGTDSSTVPFDQNGADTGGTDTSNADPVVGVNKTVYVSYTLRHRDGQWYIVEVDSSDQPLVPEQ